MNTLKEKAARWQGALKTVDTGPLVIAKEVLEFENEWDKWQEEADGLSYNEWLKLTLGPGKHSGYWKIRADAVEALGESIRRTVHHMVAVRVYRLVPREHWQEVIKELMRLRVTQGGNVATPHQADRIIRRVCGERAVRARTCKTCAEYIREISRLEFELAKAKGTYSDDDQGAGGCVGVVKDESGPRLIYGYTKDQIKQ